MHKYLAALVIAFISIASPNCSATMKLTAALKREMLEIETTTATFRRVTTTVGIGKIMLPIKRRNLII